MLSVYIIAYNEEAKVGAAIESVLWADEVVVVDSGSSDRTCEIAESYGVRVEQVPFEGFGKLRNRAVGLCSYEWILSIDSDERCTPEARDEIRTIISDPNSLDAYFVPRKNFFMGRWIKHSGWYPDYRQPQLFRKGKLLYSDDLVHEGFRTLGTVGYMKNPIWQFPFSDLSEVLRKADRYSSLGAKKQASKGMKGSIFKAFIHGIGNFLRIYIFKAGFLDGWAGFVIALGNFEGTFYRYAKLTAGQKGWDKPPRNNGQYL